MGKASHGSGRNIFVRNFGTPPQTIDDPTFGRNDNWGVADIHGRLDHFLTTSYNQGVEWAYTAERSILVEEYLHIPGTTDYKFYCFYGECQLIQVNTPNMNGSHYVCVDFYSVDWVHL